VNLTAPRLSWRFREALTVAADLHEDQKRKGTDIPYISHLLAVASIALDHDANEDQAIAALLHDSIEDAPPALGGEWVRRMLGHRFGPRVLAIVEGCTDADVRPKPPWRKRKEEYIAHLPSTPAEVLLVSAADKLHNATAILKDHRKIGDALWDRFNRDAGKAGTIGYYRGLVSAYQAAGHHPRLIGELDATVTALEQQAGMVGQWPLT
jgi:(p)ppGpp synthase/HD superfamily hydrolase